MANFNMSNMLSDVYATENKIKNFSNHVALMSDEQILSYVEGLVWDVKDMIDDKNLLKQYGMKGDF